MASMWDKAKVADGLMRIYTSVPEGKGRFPGIVVIQTQRGVDEFLQGIARRIASAGYVAMAPDLYHRDGPNRRENPAARRARLRDESVVRDVDAAVAALKAHEKVDSDSIGIIGFCMGGRVSYLMAALNPAFKAAVMYYGGGTMVPWSDEGQEGPAPFDRTAGIHCPVLGHFGAEDENPSPEDMHKLDAELTRHGKVHEFHSYPGAGHAFMNELGEGYHKEAAESSWPRTLDFFARCLGQVEVKVSAVGGKK
jgi:carboxymethylenebutenolidase